MRIGRATGSSANPNRVRYGYRRVHVMLQRDGWQHNVKKTYRICKEMGLQLRNKTPKRRVKAKLREDRKDAIQVNETWAIDFVHDQLATGRKFRILTVVDTFTRFLPIIDPRFSYRSEDVIEALEQACSQIGYPKAIRVDQGSEFISHNLACGPMPKVSRWTSHGPANQPTTPSSKALTASSALNA